MSKDKESSKLPEFNEVLDSVYHRAVTELQIKNHGKKVRRDLEKDDELIALIAQDADPEQVQALLDRKYEYLASEDKACLQGMIIAMRSFVSWTKNKLRDIIQ